MKLTELKIVRCEGGLEVSLVALLTDGEKASYVDFKEILAPFVPTAVGPVSRDTATDEERLEVAKQVTEALEEMASTDEEPVTVRTISGRRRHRNPLETEAAPEATESPTESPRRRRRAASTSESPAPLQSPAAPTDASSSAGEGQSDANPTRRRRRNEPASDAASPTSAEPSTSTASTEEPRRRRRAADAPAASEASPTATAPASAEPSATAPTEEPRRRRRAAADAPSALETSGRASGEDKITDADLSKACSDAARVLTPKVVMEFLKTFGVASAGELKAADRRRFLDGLKAKKEAA